MPLSQVQKHSLILAAVDAVACERSHLVPAELTVAQWAIESGWGKSQPGNNPFGIKEYPGCDGRQLLNTIEYLSDPECAAWLKAKPGRVAVPETTTTSLGRIKYKCKDYFATFSSLDRAFIKHSELFTNPGPYQKHMNTFLQTHDLHALMAGIAPIYATDPNYLNLLTQIVDMKEVKEAIQMARTT